MSVTNAADSFPDPGLLPDSPVHVRVASLLRSLAADVSDRCGVIYAQDLPAFGVGTAGRGKFYATHFHDSWMAASHAALMVGEFIPACPTELPTLIDFTNACSQLSQALLTAARRTDPAAALPMERLTALGPDPDIPRQDVVVNYAEVLGYAPAGTLAGKMVRALLTAKGPREDRNAADVKREVYGDRDAMCASAEAVRQVRRDANVMLEKLTCGSLRIVALRGGKTVRVEVRPVAVPGGIQGVGADPVADSGREKRA